MTKRECWTAHERHWRHYFEYEDFGPRSVNMDPDLFSTGYREPRPPEFPTGADFWIMMTVEDRIQEAERIQRRREPGFPGVKNVLRAYYAVGEQYGGTPGASVTHFRAITAVYPLTGICPEWRRGEPPHEGLERITAARGKAHGKQKAEWDRVHLRAERLLVDSRLAYTEAAETVPERKRPSRMDRLMAAFDRVLGAT